MSRISKLVQEAQKYKGQVFKQGKMFVPAGCVVPQTAKDTMARQLYQAGIITKDDYEKMLGVVYDGEYSREQEDFDDEAFSTYEEEFKLSQLAEYYDDYSTEPEEPASNTQGTQDIPAANGGETANDDGTTDVPEGETK